MNPTKHPFYFLSAIFALGAFFLSSHLEAKEHKISVIGISHSGCHGSCPVYSFLVKRDGSFEYFGARFVNHKGNWTGTVDKILLGRILKVIESSRFMGLHDKYGGSMTGRDTVSTTIVMDGTRKVVEDYAHAGPRELRSIEQATEGLIGTAKWDKH